MKNFTGNSSHKITSTESELAVGVVCGWTVIIGILLLLSAMPAFCADSSTFRGNAQLGERSLLPKLDLFAAKAGPPVHDLP